MKERVEGVKNLLRQASFENRGCRLILSKEVAIELELQLHAVLELAIKAHDLVKENGIDLWQGERPDELTRFLGTLSRAGKPGTEGNRISLTYDASTTDLLHSQISVIQTMARAYTNACNAKQG